MRTKVTLVLLLLNVALYFFIFSFERDWRAGAGAGASRRVLGPEVAAIERLEIAAAGSAPIVLEQRGGTWFLGAPHDWPANPNAVSRILNELQFLEHDTSFPVAGLADTGQSLADYGLAEPALVVRFGRGDSLTALRIGAVTQVANRLYVLSPDGTRIHVVGRSLADSLRLPLDSLRSDALFTVPVFEARSLSLQFPSPGNLRVRLSRNAGRWLFETPVQTRADKAAVDLVVNRLNALKVAAFVDARAADPAATGLANPGLRIALEGNARRETLLLGAPVPGAGTLYAKLDDRAQVFTVAPDADLLETLRNAQTALRDRRILDFEPERLSSISIRSPGWPELSLQRLETGAWQVLARPAGNQPPSPQPADAQLVGRLVDALTVLRAEEFLSDAPSAAELESWGFNRPEREILLEFAAAPGAATPAAAAITLQLAVASEREGRLYARVGGASFVYLVPPDFLGRVPVVARAFRERTVRSLPPGARITGLTLWRLADNHVVLSRQLDAAAAAAGWEQALAGDPPAVREPLLALLAELRQLRAQAFVHDGFVNTLDLGGRPRPWVYQLDATIALSAGETAQTTSSALFLSERLGGTTLLVGSAEFNTVFEATQPFTDAVFALVFAERDPGPPPAP